MREPGPESPGIAAIDDPGAFSWIASALRSPVGEPPRGDPLRTLDLIPPMFECYAKVLHPLHERDDVPDDGWGEPTGRHTTWAQLAREWGMVCDAGISEAAPRPWPSHLCIAYEGSIPPRVVRAFVRGLARGDADRVFFWWWVAAAMAFCPRPESVSHVLCRGPLRDLPEFLARERCPSPTYWWPSDRAWCVATDWDLPFTMIGGPASIVRRLLSDPDVEGHEVGERDIVLRYSERRPEDGSSGP